jgi:glycosyltransferase involved in cell wall biosynthesis
VFGYKMRLSVAMAVYNGARYLAEQLDSIARQSRAPDELVISDNHSTDGTTKIVEAFASSAPFPVRLHVNEANLGISKNFEQAIRLCSGEVICLSDCDDIWYANKLQRIEEVFSAAPSVGIVFSDADLVHQDLTPIGYSLHQSFRYGRTKKLLLKGGAEAVRVLLAKRFPMFGNTMAFRARFEQSFLPMPEIGAMFSMGFHDIWIAVIIASIADLAIVPERLVAYRQHDRQSGGSPLRASLRKRLRRAFQPFNPAPTDVARLLCQRLIQANTHDDLAGAGLSIVSAWSHHLSARAELPIRRSSRLPLVWRELITGRYHRFSSGLLTATKDLLVARKHCFMGACEG